MMMMMMMMMKIVKRKLEKTSNEEYLDFVDEADNFVRKKDKEILKNKVKRRKIVVEAIIKKKVMTSQKT